MVRHNGCLEGVEVTRFTSQDDQVVHTIINENRGTTESIETIKKNAIAKHGQKAEQYGFYKIGEKLAVSPGLIDITQQKEVYALLIVQKYEKYCNEIEKYDCFTILCDARWGLEVSNRYDIEDLMAAVSQHKFLHSFNVAILYYDGSELRCYQHQIKRGQ